MRKFPNFLGPSETGLCRLAPVCPITANIVTNTDVTIFPSMKSFLRFTLTAALEIRQGTFNTEIRSSIHVSVMKGRKLSRTSEYDVSAIN